MATAEVVVTGKRGGMNHLDSCLLGARSLKPYRGSYSAAIERTFDSQGQKFGRCLFFSTEGMIEAPRERVMSDFDGMLALDRMERAVEKVRDRLLRSTAALEAAGIPYAVIGGNAVMAWVEQVDESAVRFTQDVDIVLRREDFGRATEALALTGFHHRHSAGIDMFLDGPGAKARDAVHVIFSGEKVRPEYASVVPDTDESVSFKSYRVLALEALVRMKLTSYRRKDQVHLLYMLEIGLIDASWPTRYPPELAARLQHLIDTPDG